MSTPRGIINNNPGNIRVGPAAWQGKIPVEKNTDKVFEQFTSMAYGVRALMKNLQGYFSSGKNTIRKIINTWAPPSENDTGAYVNTVSKITGLGADQVITPSQDVLTKLARAISIVENGAAFEVPMATIQEAYKLLTGGTSGSAGIVDQRASKRKKILIGVGIGLALLGTGIIIYKKRKR
jgi:hypothetical protein